MSRDMEIIIDIAILVLSIFTIIYIAGRK